MADPLMEALRKGRKSMGKLVKFQRGIATVMPVRSGGLVSQNASQKGFSIVRDLRTLNRKT